MDEHLAKIPETALKGCTPANVKALVLSELAKIKFRGLDHRGDASSPAEGPEAEGSETPGDKESARLRIPFKNGVLPAVNMVAQAAEAEEAAPVLAEMVGSLMPFLQKHGNEPGVIDKLMDPNEKVSPNSSRTRRLVMLSSALNAVKRIKTSNNETASSGSGT